MNNVSLIGRLTADPELRHTPAGMAVLRFSIAVDRSYTKQGEERQADFINIVAFNQRAEFISKYFTKGQRIAIIGEIRTGSYTDKEGKKRYTFDVVVNNAEFCESKKSAGAGSAQTRYEIPSFRSASDLPESAPAMTDVSADTGDFMVLPGDEDLPF